MTNDSRDGKEKLAIEFRAPTADDGFPVYQLIGRCPPLDTNSIYCNLIQCGHFSGTCVLALYENEPVGFVSAYIKPTDPNVLFVWQIAVDEKARGQGLAHRMLDQLLARPAVATARFLETTITPDNQPSQALFRKLAKRLETDLNESVLFEREKHFGGNHNEEMLFRIGPFDLPATGENS